MALDSIANLGKNLLPIFKEFEVKRRHFFMTTNEHVG
jgi:hypothetical protein